LIFLAKAGSEAKHQLRALDFVQPIAQGGVKFVLLGRDNACGAKRAESGASESAVTVDRPIACRGAPFVILGQEYYDGDAAAGVDAQLGDQFTFLRPLDEAQIDFF
jgi:hypothetical protein